jgi:hypothetical protein
MLKAEFQFLGKMALGPNENVYESATETIYVKLTRRLRTEAFPHQPQRALFGAILGYETILEIRNLGKPAAGYRFELLREGKLIQRGRTDKDGLAGEVMVGLPKGRELEFRLKVRDPGRRRPSLASSAIKAALVASKASETENATESKGKP